MSAMRSPSGLGTFPHARGDGRGTVPRRQFSRFTLFAFPSPPSPVERSGEGLFMDQ